MIEIGSGKETFRLERLNATITLPVVETKLAFDKIVTELRGQNLDNHGIYLQKVIEYIHRICNQTLTLDEADAIQAEISKLWVKKNTKQTGEITSMLKSATTMELTPGN